MGRAVAWSPKSWGDEFDVILKEPHAAPFTAAGSFAVVSICGMLFQHDHWLCDSYDSIKTRMAAALASGQPAVLMWINSPGGDFAGCLDVSRELRAMAGSAKKRLVAFTDAQCSSAAYGIATAADEIVTSESAMLGSVGVWMPMQSLVEANAKQGVEWRIVASGARKLDRNPNVAITPDAEAATQEKVDGMASLFFDLVAEHRGLPRSRVEALEGDEFLGIKAVSVGFADRTGTLEELTSTNVTAPRGASGAGAMAKAGDKDDKKNKDDAGDEWGEHLKALHAAAEQDDERGKMAKRMLAAMYSDALDGDPPKKEDVKDSGPKETGPGESKAVEQGEPSKELKEENASALAMSLARDLQALKAKDAARDAAEAQAKADAKRAEIFAKRPDISPAQQATLAYVPVDKLDAELAKWPRVVSAPGASAAALTPDMVRERKDAARARSAPLSAEQEMILARVRNANAQASSNSVHTDGSVELNVTDRATARRLLEERRAQRGAA
jgi:ClpP class serine protease